MRLNTGSWVAVFAFMSSMGCLVAGQFVAAGMLTVTGWLIVIWEWDES